MAQETKRLSDLADFVGVQIDPALCPNSIYVGLEHITSGRLVRVGNGKASDVRSSKFAFEAGDVLYGKLRPYLDKAVLAFDSGICTTELLVLRPKEGVDPRFLVSVIHTPAFIEHAISGTTGVQHPRTSWKHISNFEIPAFDSDDQTRIADLLWAIHTAVTANEAAIEVTAELKGAAMRALFTRGLRGEIQKETEIGPMPESWELVSIADVFRIVHGVSLKGNLSTDGQGTPFLRTSNVYWGSIALQSVSRVHLDGTISPTKLLRKGDLLVCEGGEIGRAAVWEGDIEGCLFQNHLHCLRPIDANRTESRFAMAWFEEGFKHRNTYQGVGNRTTIPNISRSRLAELAIPHPRLDEQREIVAILKAIDHKISLHRRKKTVLNDLFYALLNKLMTGEIRVGQLDSAEIP